MPVNEPVKEPVIVQKMVFEQTMKRSFKFVASDFGMPISSLYIDRLAFPDGCPRFVWLSINEVVE